MKVRHFGIALGIAVLAAAWYYYDWKLALMLFLYQQLKVGILLLARR